MGIYAGVNGVRRKISQPYVGVNGARRTISKGFLGRSGTRYQFFGPLEDVASVEVRPEWIWLQDMDSNGNASNAQVFNSASGISSYGYVSISGNTISICCSTRGKYFSVTGYIYAIFLNGREVMMNWLSNDTPAYGASMSLPVGYYQHMGGNDYSTGAYGLSCCGESVYSSYVDISVSGTTTLTRFPGSDFYVGAGVKTGSGSSTTQMTFSSINIDGRNVPVRVVSKLT